MIGSDIPVAPANVGPRSTPNYEEALGKAPVQALANGDKVFAGPRNDAFFVDLGSVFDLLGLRPLNSACARSMRHTRSRSRPLPALTTCAGRPFTPSPCRSPSPTSP